MVIMWLFCWDNLFNTMKSAALTVCNELLVLKRFIYFCFQFLGLNVLQLEHNYFYPVIADAYQYCH